MTSQGVTSLGEEDDVTRVCGMTACDAAGDVAGGEEDEARTRIMSMDEKYAGKLCSARYAEKLRVVMTTQGQ